jgi:hypothetical protein
MVLNGTIGQTAIGTGASASYGLIAGYWQDFGGGGCCVIPGDANHDGSRDISDLTYFVDFMFGGGPAPICQEEFDNDGNCSQDISDLTYYVDFMFGGGPDPVSSLGGWLLRRRRFLRKCSMRTAMTVSRTDALGRSGSPWSSCTFMMNSRSSPWVRQDLISEENSVRSSTDSGRRMSHTFSGMLARYCLITG